MKETQSRLKTHIRHAFPLSCVYNLTSFITKNAALPPFEKKVQKTVELQLIALSFLLVHWTLFLPYLLFTDSTFGLYRALIGSFVQIALGALMIYLLKHKMCTPATCAYITAAANQLPYAYYSLTHPTTHYIIWFLRSVLPLHASLIAVGASGKHVLFCTILFFVPGGIIVFLQTFGTVAIVHSAQEALNMLTVDFALSALVNIVLHVVFQCEMQIVFDKVISASEHKTAFLSSVSHELRTPLFGVSGAMELLNGTSLTQKQKKLVDIARSCSNNLLSTINSVLDLSKIEQGSLSIDNHIVNLNSLIDSTMANCSPIALRSKIDIRIELGMFVPTYFQGDEFRLCQILTNLLTNALKFSPQNSYIVISVSVENTVTTTFASTPDNSRRNSSGIPSGKARSFLLPKGTSRPHPIKRISSSDCISHKSRQRYLRFAIQDKGQGLLEHEKERIFEAFTQIRRDGNKTRYGGVGLGLAICQQLCQKMGGHIGVYSSGRHKGSTFYFYIPYKDEQLKKKQPWSNINRLTPNAATTARMFERRASLPGMPIYNSNLSAIIRPKLRRSLSCNNLPTCKAPLYQKANTSTNMRASTGRKSIKRAVSSRYFVSKNRRKQKTTNHDVDNASLPAKKPSKRKKLKFQNPIFRNPILIAEDNEVNRTILKQFLDRMGIEPVFAANGVEALAIFSTRKFSLILMDLEMPKMGGIETTKEIRKTDKTTPIVALSAHALVEHQQFALNAGMNRFLSKPFTFEALYKVISVYAAVEK